MGDPLFEVLSPYFGHLDASTCPSATDPTTHAYLNRLTTLSLSDLTGAEPGSLAHSSQTLLRSVQALSKKSHRSVILGTSQLSSLSAALPRLFQSSAELQNALPGLDSAAEAFAEKYKRSSEADDEALVRRKKVLLLSQNAERISSLLDLPTLLSSAISSSQSSAGSSVASSSGGNYASALDLHSHIKRLTSSYPNSPLIASINVQAEREIKLLTAALISSLQSHSVKLASAMRTISWLRRVAPELDEQLQLQRTTARLGKNFRIESGKVAEKFANTDGALGAVFLTCRLAHFLAQLDALEPLRELADQETQTNFAGKDVSSTTASARRQSQGKDRRWLRGQQTERFLKRYIEIFREQSFAIVSMYKNIFPSVMPAPGSGGVATAQGPKADVVSGNDMLDGFVAYPSPLASFPSYLVDMLFETLRQYLPNLEDRAARDSLLTQVLYCAGSLGRLGSDFTLMLALLVESTEEDLGNVATHERMNDWVEIMKKHRVQASRLELLASGVGANAMKKDVGSPEAIVSPTSG